MNHQDERINVWVGMSHIVVYWLGDSMYTAAFTKLEYAEQEIERLRKDPDFSAYELYETKAIKCEDFRD